MFFCESCKFLKNTCFSRTPPIIVSDGIIKSIETNWSISTKWVNPSRHDLGQREKIKALKAFMNPFEETQRSVKIKI